MKNTKKQQIFRTILITSIVLASAVLQAQVVFAQAVYQQTCKLGVFPYNTSGTYKEGDAGTPYINFLSDGTCKTHLLYPQTHNWTQNNAYNVKPPSESENTVKSNASTIHIPISYHSHAYFNDTPEDSTYYTKSFTDQFEIQIQSDAWDNIYLDQISCDITVPTGYAGDTSDLRDNCEGSSPLFGGTTATKSFDYTNKKLTINFRFAPPGGNGRPTLYGKNGNGFITYKDYNNNGVVEQASEKLNTFDSSGYDPYSHELEFAVNLPTKDAGTIWSATTTSRALIRNLALKRTNYPNNFYKGCSGNDVNNANSGWCYQNVLPGYQTAQVTSGSGTYDYFWYTIGSVANIWRKPPPEQLCNSFQISPITLTEADLPKTINITNVSTTGGLQLDYKWTADNTGGFISFDNDPAYTGNARFTSATSVTIKKAKDFTGPITVYVNGVKKGTTAPVYTGGCQKQLTLTKTDKNCLNLTVNPSGPFTSDNMPQTITVTSSASGGLQLANKWTASDNQSTVRFDDTFTYTGSPYFDPNNQTKIALLKSITNPVTVFVTAVDATNQQEYPGVNNVCKKQIVINPPTTSPTCSGITLQPNYVNAPGQTSYITTVTFSDGQSYNTTVNWTGTNGTFTKPANETQFSGVNPNLYQYTNTFNTQNTTASVTAKVTSVVGATNSAICQNGVKVEQKPLKPYCTSVTLSPNSLTAPGTTPFTATVTYSDGTSHNTELTWSQSNGGLSDAVVQQHQSSQNFTNTYTTTNNNGSVSAKVTQVLDPNVDNSDICKKGASVSTNPGNPYCLNFTLAPSELNTTGSTNLSGKASFSDGNNYDTTVQWSGNNGTYNGPATKTQNSSNPFLNTFTILNENNQASASAAVTAIPGNPNVGLGNCAAAKTVYTPPKKDKCEDISVYKSGNELCLNWEGGYNGSFTWHYGSTYKNGICSGEIPQNTSWNVWAKDEPNNLNCQDSGKTEKRPPRAYKGVRRSGNSSFVKVISIPSNNKDVDYQLTFEADPGIPTSARIIDTISKGYIDGMTMPKDIGNGNIRYVSGSTQVNRKQCASPDDTNCWMGEIGTAGGLKLNKVTGTVIITYKGKIIDSAITPAICVEGEVCEEIYKNQAKIEWWTYDSDDKETQHETVWTDFARVQIFCQYILTRAAGDIYMESDFTAGVDIRQCSKYTSTPGLVIVPATPENPGLSSTGEPSQIFTINHEICTEGQAGTLNNDLSNYYGQTVSNLSSQICEVRLQPGTGWQQTSITNSIEENKTRISRWDEDNLEKGPNVKIGIEELIQGGVKNVYRIKDANLQIGKSGLPYTLFDGEGAKTFIVENGDLYIDSNILYGACNKEVCTINDIASLAFIVLNGNVYVDRDVTEMDGVFFVQSDDSENGKLFNTPTDQPSEKQLVILGSVYGDIQPLFIDRLFAGDPALEEAGILIRFDERIILNTPPGLRDVLSFSQSEVAR